MLSYCYILVKCFDFGNKVVIRRAVSINMLILYYLFELDEFISSFFKNFAVCDFLHFIMCSGVP